MERNIERVIMKIRGNEIILLFVLAMSSFKTSLCVIYLLLPYITENQYAKIGGIILYFICIYVDYSLISRYKFCISKIKEIESIYITGDTVKLNLTVTIIPSIMLGIAIYKMGINSFSIASIIILLIYSVFNIISYFNTSELEYAFDINKCPPVGYDISIIYKVKKGVAYK